MALVQVTAPTSEPVSLADAKLHVGVATDDSDAYIASLVKAAREWAETYTRRSMLTTTWRQTLSCWPSDGVIELHRPPLQSVTSVTYYDTDGDSTTLATSHTDSEPGRVLRGYGITWPALRTDGVAAPATVTYIAGHSAAASVPGSTIHAIKMLVGHWFENREEIITGAVATKIPMAARALLSGVSHGSYP